MDFSNGQLEEIQKGNATLAQPEDCLPELARAILEARAEVDHLTTQEDRHIADKRKLREKLETSQGRIYKLGLLCDKVPGLQDGYCPEGPEPRDNLTRIGIALEAGVQRTSVLVWLGRWREELPDRAVTALQDVLHITASRGEQ